MAVQRNLNWLVTLECAVTLNCPATVVTTQIRHWRAAISDRYIQSSHKHFNNYTLLTEDNSPKPNSQISYPLDLVTVSTLDHPLSATTCAQNPYTTASSFKPFVGTATAHLDICTRKNVVRGKPVERPKKHQEAHIVSPGKCGAELSPSWLRATP